jgi:hypothetical protein
MSAISSSEKVILTGYPTGGKNGKEKTVDIFDSRVDLDAPKSKEALEFMHAVKGLNFREIEVVDLSPSTSAAALAEKPTTASTAATNPSNSSAAASAAAETTTSSLEKRMAKAAYEAKAFGKSNPFLAAKALGFFS